MWKDPRARAQGERNSAMKKTIKVRTAIKAGGLAGTNHNQVLR